MTANICHHDGAAIVSLHALFIALIVYNPGGSAISPLIIISLVPTSCGGILGPCSANETRCDLTTSLYILQTVQVENTKLTMMLVGAFDLQRFPEVLDVH